MGDKAKDLTEKSSEGETNQETPEPSEQISSNDQDTTEKSSESSIKDEIKDIEKEEDANENLSQGEIKDITKDKENEEKAKDPVEKSSVGVIKEEMPKSSNQISLKDQVMIGMSSECKIKDDMKDKKKEEEAKELVEKFSEEGEMKVEGKERKKDSSENVEESGKIDEVVSTNSANQVHSCNTINHNMEEQNKLNGKINKEEDQLIDQISTNEVQENRNLHVETKEVNFSKWA